MTFVSNRNKTALCAAALVLSGMGCREDDLVEDPNRAPEAIARVFAEDGRSVDEQFDGGAGPRFAFDGTEITITLDGSESSDADGRIEEYRWLTGTPDRDAGTGRLVPEGEDPSWPADVERPEVRVGEGIWTFTLWVKDDDGAVSAPDAITFTVGDPKPPPPPPAQGEAVQQCVDNVVPTVASGCARCVCEASEDCRMAADPDVCGEACWGLLACIGMHCPDYAMTMDLQCLTEHCMEFLADGAAGAQRIGGCVTGCASECGE